MNHNETTAATLARYINAFKRDELKNEPARLLCEYLVSELDLEDKPTAKDVLSKWLDNANLDKLGDTGELGGVSVTASIEQDIVEYGSGDDYLSLTADALLKLAEEAENTENPTPIPDWYEESWKGVTLGLAEQHIQDMNCARAMDVLRAQGVSVRIEDGAPEFRVGFHWFDDPKAALLELVEDLSTKRRAEVLGLA